jgi:hypothetical protein
MSEVETSKYFKFINSFSEGEIAIAIASCNSTEQKALSNVTKTLANKLEKGQCNVKVPKKQSTKKRADKTQIFYEALKQMKSNLSVYSSSLEIDVLYINFKLHANYSILSESDLIKEHNNLISVGQVTNKIKLLVLSERGKLY